MSICISREGEFGSHVLDDAYTCSRCLVLDEDAMIADLRGLRARLAEALAEVERLRGENERLTFSKQKLTETVHAFPDANNAANLAHARAERDRMRPVVQAAIDWRSATSRYSLPLGGPLGRLLAAVDDYTGRDSDG